ncbi:helix-turn-helix domain-containing protein, partial [Clostridium sp. Mt-5]
CSINKTATYQKVFKPIENTTSQIYNYLPEKTIAQKIRKIRKIHGYTQRDFANICSIGYSSLCKYEIGQNPDIKNLKKICNTFSIPLNYFHN